MSRLRDALIRHVIFVVAIPPFNHRRCILPAKARQAPAEGKSEAANTEKCWPTVIAALVTLLTAKSWGLVQRHRKTICGGRPDAVGKLARSIRQGGFWQLGQCVDDTAPGFERRAACANRGWILSLKDAQPLQRNQNKLRPSSTSTR